MSFVEMEHRVIVTTEKPSDPSKMQVLYDTDLIVSYNLKDLDKKPQQLQRKDGWRIVSWSRPVSSNCWEKGCEADAVDIFFFERLTAGALPDILEGVKGVRQTEKHQGSEKRGDI